MKDLIDLRVEKDYSELNLSGKILDKKSLKELCDYLINNDTIQKLNLTFTLNHLGNENLDTLLNIFDQNRTIRSLNLSSNKMNAKSVEIIMKHLKNNHSLHEINLKLNNIGDKGAIYIAGIIKETKTINKLNLSNNNINEKGANIIKDALNENKTIIEIMLSYSILPHNIKDSINIIVSNNQKLVLNLAKFIVKNFENHDLLSLNIDYKYFEAFRFYQMADKNLLTTNVEALSQKKGESRQIFQKVEQFIKNHFFEVIGVSKKIDFLLPEVIENVIDQYSIMASILDIDYSSKDQIT